jgi:hypothetical protein
VSLGQSAFTLSHLILISYVSVHFPVFILLSDDSMVWVENRWALTACQELSLTGEPLNPLHPNHRSVQWVWSSIFNRSYHVFSVSRTNSVFHVATSAIAFSKPAVSSNTFGREIAFGGTMQHRVTQPRAKIDASQGEDCEGLAEKLHPLLCQA